MGLFSKLKTWASFGSPNTIGGFIAPIQSYDSTYTAQNALAVSAVLCATRTIANGVAAAPIRVMKKYRDESGRVRIEEQFDHWAVSLLNRKPNHFQNSHQFIQTMMINALLGKGGLALKIKDTKGNITSLIPVQNWAAQQQQDGTIIYAIHNAEGQFVQNVSDSDVILVRNISVDGVSSVSLLDSARSALGITQALEKIQLDYSKNGNKIPGYLHTEEVLSEEASKRLKGQFLSAGSGLPLLDKKIEYVQLGASMVDSQFIENRKFQINEIARIFNIHPAMIMSEMAGITGAEELFVLHVQNTLMPWFKAFESELNRSLLGSDLSHYFDFDETALLRGNSGQQANYITTALGKGGAPGWLSVNEVRQSLGYDAVQAEWADEVVKGGYLLSNEAKIGTDSAPTE